LIPVDKKPGGNAKGAGVAAGGLLRALKLYASPLIILITLVLNIMNDHLFAGCIPLP
jgi:hypothetical protein